MPSVPSACDRLRRKRPSLTRALVAAILAAVSRDLRRDRELAFDGAEDLTPSTFYSEADAARAREAASWTVGVVTPCVPL